MAYLVTLHVVADDAFTTAQSHGKLERLFSMLVAREQCSIVSLQLPFSREFAIEPVSEDGNGMTHSVTSSWAQSCQVIRRSAKFETA
jgi:hypothetical protein